MPTGRVAVTAVRAAVSDAADASRARPPWPWRAASWIATLAAGAALAAVLAHWGWRAFAPQSMPLLRAEPPEPWTPAIVKYPLFGRLGEVAGEGAGPLPSAPSMLQGDTRLLGIFAERDGRGYALFRLPDRGPLLVSVGQEIAKEVRLEAVNVDGVRIRDHGETRELRLRTDPVAAKPATERPSRAAARAACVPPAGYRGPVYRLNAELLTGVASHPESWKALLAPADGGLMIRDGSGFAAMLGMKAGDRMAQANGIALGTVDDVLVAVVKPLIASQSVRMVGTRDGKAAEWLFLNAGACPG